MSTHEERQERLLAVLGTRDEAALLVTDLDNVRYLTGLASSNAIALIGPTVRMLFTDSRYATLARTAAQGAQVVIAGRDVGT